MLERVVQLGYGKAQEERTRFQCYSFWGGSGSYRQVEPPKPKPTFDAKALGHLGELKGGRARAVKLTPERRTEIARKAANASWGKQLRVWGYS